jgi:hypothetical protein
MGISREKVRPIMAACLIMAGMLGCTTTEIVTANSTPARQSMVNTPQHLLLDIGIVPFDPNIPATAEAAEKALIIPDVRRAEAQFIAYQLKDTLELTGNWGAVRVTPEPSVAVDLVITGKIEESDGEHLSATVRAVDATGVVWLDKTYEDSATKYSYERTKEDPFQDFYNRIADDLLKHRDTLPSDKLVQLRQVAALRYASDLSPEAFSKYLNESRGKTTVKQLPAEQNAMLARVEDIKEREHLFVDTLDDYYGQFYKEMRPSYDAWRLATYEEAVRLRMMEKQARNRLLGGAALIVGGIYGATESGTYAAQAAAVGAVVGGIGLVKSGMDRMKEAEIHEQSLRELSHSLGSEIKPYVLQIEGRTVELTGSADAQYQQWRKILKEIYVAETGTPIDQPVH